MKHKRCVHEGCLKRPSFNYTGETRALYCGPHRLTGMVNVDQERRRINRGVHSLAAVTLSPTYGVVTYAHSVQVFCSCPAHCTSANLQA